MAPNTPAFLFPARGVCCPHRMSQSHPIAYLDHAAATDVHPSVQALVQTLLQQEIKNPSSVHHSGRNARTIIDRARATVAEILRKTPEQIVFTSGATESVAHAMVGGCLCGSKPPTILVSPFAHSCVQAAAQWCVRHIGATVVALPVQGALWDIPALHEASLKDITLIAVEDGNSETGAIQDIPALLEQVKNHNPSIPVIVDGAAGFVGGVESYTLSGVSAYTLSGEKCGGLAGTGCLVLGEGFSPAPIIPGTQERGYRGGTQNTIGIAAFAHALELFASEKTGLIQKWGELKKRLIAGLRDIPGITQTLEGDIPSLPHIHHILLPEGWRGDSMVARLDMQGVAVSAGTACSSGSVSASPVLQAMGYDESTAQRGIRISFGRTTTHEDIDFFLAKLSQSL